MADRFETEERRLRRQERVSASYEEGGTPALTASVPVTCRQLIVQAFQDLRILHGTERLEPVYAIDGMQQLRQVVEAINLSPELAPDLSFKNYDLTGLGEADISGSWKIQWGLNEYSEQAEPTEADPEPVQRILGINDIPPMCIEKLWLDNRLLTPLTPSQFAHELDGSTASDSYSYWHQKTSPSHTLWFPNGSPGGLMRALIYQGICLPLNDDDALRDFTDPDAIRLDLPEGYTQLLRTELTFRLAAMFGKTVIPESIRRMNREARSLICERNYEQKVKPSAWADIGDGNVRDDLPVQGTAEYFNSGSYYDW